MNDVEIKALVNAAVDRELADYRVAPPWQPAHPLHRPGHPIGRWSLPVLAASVAALLVAVTVLAIGHDRDRRATPAGHSTSPAPSASPSVSRSVNPDQVAAAREYADAVAGAAQDPSTVAGVSISALSAEDALRLKNSGALRADATEITDPQPGKTYSFTMSYLAGPGQDVRVVSIHVRDVATGSCPQPFLTRGAYTYQIRCQVTFLAGVIGKATLVAQGPGSVASASVDLTDPAKYLKNTVASASRAYTAAIADAPEASTVAGVADRSATAAEQRRSTDSVGSLHLITDPKPGKSYPITLLYVPSSAAPPLSVLAFRFEGVVAGHCPRAFRVRPAHAYQISCQVTFQPGVKAWVYYDVTGPQGMEPTGLGLF